LLTEYNKAPKVTRDRIYIDTVEAVLSNTSKIMVDVKGSNNLLYLPLDQLMKNRPVNADASEVLQSPLKSERVLDDSSRRINLRTRETR